MWFPERVVGIFIPNIIFMSCCAYSMSFLVNVKKKWYYCWIYMDCPFLQEFRETDAYTGRKCSANVKWLCYKHANSQVLNDAEFIYSSNISYRTIVEANWTRWLQGRRRFELWPGHRLSWLRIFMVFLSASRQIPG